MTSLTPEQKLVLEANLAAAEKAYHNLMIGGGVAEIRDQNQELVRFTAANRSALIGYINSLRAQLGLCPMQGIVSRPAGVFI